MTDPVPADLADALATSADQRGGLGDPLYYFQETGSTNDVAARLAEAGAGHGTLVVAGRQTAGRGRLGRQWFSPAGAGLYVSLISRSTEAAPLLTIAGGVAVAQGVTHATGLPVQIKWPNDVVVSRSAGSPPRWRKLAGILAEASSGERGLIAVVLGFGINMRPSAYPPAIADRATSLESELGRPVESGPVLAAILVALAAALRAIENGRRDRVLADWRAGAPALEGSAVEFECEGARRGGTAVGIADDGALLVRTAAGVERVISGEVSWR
jgi:BirA family transcriptional regulator, biotin operon repressor / biotin---[acetyl-CoA-carboxylase] ligase